jgi:hypothetical protein
MKKFTSLGQNLTYQLSIKVGPESVLMSHFILKTHHNIQTRFQLSFYFSSPWTHKKPNMQEEIGSAFLLVTKNIINKLYGHLAAHVLQSSKVKQ